ncbi:NlpC/P60 family protein [Streptomyces tritici]|uniref:C40 family peptidase n=1 Tax=Streptomyces tritici TaxID=2054410 RepID=UPI003AF15708
MAAHRKPKQRPLGGRTAATLALAGAATATVLDGSGHAEPRPTPGAVKAEVDRLHREAEEATERYNGAKEEADEARRALDGLRDEAARRTARLNSARTALGSAAAAQYRSGGLDPAVQLALSSDPDEYLERAALAEHVGRRQAVAIASVRRELTEIGRLRAESTGKLAELKRHETALARHKSTVQSKLSAARTLLARLTAEQRRAYEEGIAGRDGRQAGTAAGRADRTLPRGSVQAPNPRAAQAVAFAYGAIGKPYVWGATGPNAYDCSGLTQAAWRSAGVSLPRTTYTQINAGQRVSRSQLAPGDLVFFYSGISHVGLYIGGGQMIHAPRPGAPVRIAPIDQMPFAGATRVG